MLNLKKTAIAVLALGSSAVFAGTMGPVCTPGSVTVPCESTGWDFGIRALYLQDNDNDYIRITEEQRRRGFQDGDDWNHHRGHGSEWNWGFELEGSYHFGTGNDFTVNWYHLDAGNGDHHRRDGRRDRDDNNNAFQDRDRDSITLNGRQNRPQWDAVNFELAQSVMFGEHSTGRIHAGVQYANIERRNGFRDIFTSHEKANGVGPRVGLDMHYNFGNGFSIFGSGATALLVGDSKFRYESILPVDIHIGNRDSLIPEIEGRIGAAYTYAMASGELTMDVAYMAVNYFDGLQTAPLGSSDFALSGIIFGVNYKGTIA
jgi:hypothetical protein